MDAEELVKMDGYFKRNWDLLGLWIVPILLFVIIHFIAISLFKVNVNSFTMDRWLTIVILAIFFFIALFRNILIKD